MIPQGAPIIRYPFNFAQNNAPIAGVLTQDLSGEKAAFLGPLDSPTWVSGTKTITGVVVRYTSVTVGTGSTWRVSLQDLAAATVPLQPDGVVDQEWTGAPQAGWSTSDVTHTFTTTRTVSKGDRLAVVFDYSVFGSGTILSLGAIDILTPEFVDVGCVNMPNGGAWALSGDIPNIEFVCDDGSRIYFRDCYFRITTFAAGTDYNQSGTGTTIDAGDERGILWVPRRSYELSEVSAALRLTNASSTADLCLYRDNTLLASRSFSSADNRNLSVHLNAIMRLNTKIVVSAGENIRLTLKPTSGSSFGIRWYRYTLDSVDSRIRFLGGNDFEPNVSVTNRVDEGAWNTPATADTSLAVGMQFFGRQIAAPGQHIVFR